MSRDSWLKVSLPALPVAFTIFGVWLYWGDNPLPTLAPAIAFWGVVVLYYLFSHFDVPGRRYPLFIIILTTVLWLVSSITAHNLGKFLSSSRNTGWLSVLSAKDFWYSYICSIAGWAAGLVHFFRLEPMIVAKLKDDRERAEKD